MEPPVFIRAVKLCAPLPNAYYARLPAVQALCEPLVLHAPVTFLTGENGSGKSTLLEAIAVAAGFNPEGGSRNFHFATHATHSSLASCLTLIRAGFPKDGFFLRAESFYNVASELERLNEIVPVLKSYGGKSLHEQSHGESFLALIQNRFSGKGLFLLDEPEAALSPQRQLVLLAELHRLAKAGAQLLVATHSPILLSLPGAEILQLDSDGISRVSYEQSMPYRVTRGFLDAPDRTLRILLKEDS